MSSTSSNDCLYGQYFQSPANFSNIGPRPLVYQTLNPLIYYAHVQPQQIDKRSKEFRKTNPNCFAKAFRWYTQAHVPPQPQAPVRQPELSSFAVWLDQKYNEFIQNQECEDCCQGPNNAPSYGPDNMNANNLCKGNRKNFFCKAKSPWLRKQQHESAKEQDCKIDKPSQSLEFILKPKDLSRPTSEYYNQKSFSNRSKVSMTTSETYSKKAIAQCPNLEKCVVENRSCVSEVNRNEGPNIQCASFQRKSEVKAIPFVNETLTLNRSCQCPESRLVTANAETQHSTVGIPCDRYQVSEQSTKSLPKNLTKLSGVLQGYNQHLKNKRNVSSVSVGTRITCECNVKMVSTVDARSQNRKKDVQCFCVLDNSRTMYDSRTVNVVKTVDKAISVHQSQLEQQPVLCCDNCPLNKLQRQPSLKIMNESHGETFKKQVVTKSTNELCIQTSDRAINLECPGTRNYPLFMKIICADKLKEECCTCIRNFK